MIKSMAIKNLASGISFAASVSLLAACGGSGSGTSTTSTGAAVTGQAVDGYIVRGRTFCDSVEKSATKVGGKYSCPNGTKIIKIIGGVDVGYDETATTSDVAYNGILIGSAKYKFVTPITTLAMELSGGEENYDPSKLSDSIKKLKDVLNLSSVDLNKNPAKNIEMARVGAQVNLIVGTFSASRDEYKKVMKSMADLIKEKAQNSEKININGSNKQIFKNTITELFHKLKNKYDDLDIVKENTDIDPVIVVIEKEVIIIQKSKNPKSIKPKPTFRGPALLFLKNQGLVKLIDQNDTMFTYSIKDFENQNVNDHNEHDVVITNGFKRVALDKSAIRVIKTLKNASVDVGLSIDKFESEKKLNVIIKDVKISMVKGDPSSIDIKIPDGTIIEVQGIDKNGTSTQVEVEKDGDRIFSSSADGINLDFDYVADELTKKGYPDFTQETGNFRVTYVVNGYELGRLKGTEKTRAKIYYVETDKSFLSGRGVRGYVTVK